MVIDTGVRFEVLDCNEDVKFFKRNLVSQFCLCDHDHGEVSLSQKWLQLRDSGVKCWAVIKESNLVGNIVSSNPECLMINM